MATEEFTKAFDQLPKPLRERFKKQLKQVQEDPFSIGKPLGYPWLRELKNEGHRLYYFIGEETVIVLLVNVSNKKEQRAAIKQIREHLNEFKEYLGLDAIIKIEYVNEIPVLSSGKRKKVMNNTIKK